MRSIDLTPLLRTTIGFDQINRLFDTVAGNGSGEATYPPYNIEKSGEDNYRISMALAGFSESDLDVTLQDGVLTIAGKAQQDEEGRNFLYRGIAQRAFERRFRLADTIRVKGATFENGMLHVDLVREVPEHMKPRKIEISTGSQPKVIEGKSDAKTKSAA
ncbi:MAG: heat-shock protein [Alphaproteobacteria bacterium]|nr:MAG: heat-shock protein [Alphaproteobacteria bacterium]